MENNLIGNVPNVSADMENDVSLMANDMVDVTTETINVSTYDTLSPINFYLDRELNFEYPSDFDPSKLFRLIYSAPPQIMLYGRDGYSTEFSYALNYVGVKLPLWFRDWTIAYTGSIGSPMAFSVSNPGRWDTADAIIDGVYTFNYMEFTWCYKDYFKWQREINDPEGDPVHTEANVDPIIFTIIYANRATVWQM